MQLSAADVVLDNVAIKARADEKQERYLTDLVNALIYLFCFVLFCWRGSHICQKELPDLHGEEAQLSLLVFMQRTSSQ